MKVFVLLLFSFFHFLSNSQSLVYQDKKIYYGDTVVYHVLEIQDGNELRAPDYFESDSSQYYDYLVVDTNNREVLFLKNISGQEKSDGHFPDRFVAHRVLITDDLSRGIDLGVVTENDLSILSDSKTYRNFLVTYFIDYGLLTRHGLDSDMFGFFQFQHRKSRN